MSTRLLPQTKEYLVTAADIAAGSKDFDFTFRGIRKAIYVSIRSENHPFLRANLKYFTDPVGNSVFSRIITADKSGYWDGGIYCNEKLRVTINTAQMTANDLIIIFVQLE